MPGIPRILKVRARDGDHDSNDERTKKQAHCNLPLTGRRISL
jgi:hypothetical protein